MDALAVQVDEPDAEQPGSLLGEQAEGPGPVEGVLALWLGRKLLRT